MHFTNFDLCQYCMYWHSDAFDVIGLHATNKSLNSQMHHSLVKEDPWMGQLTLGSDRGGADTWDRL